MSDLRARAESSFQVEIPMDPDDLDGPSKLMTLPAGTAFPASMVPDLTDSPNVADLNSKVHAAWSRVMADVQWVGKEHSTTLKYSFRGIDAVLNAVGPALRKHGVLVMPVQVEPEFTTINTRSGAVMNYCRATVTYAIFGPLGDRFPVDGVSLGEAFDSGDKASTKAQSIALRTFYINALAIPTNEPERDTEHGEQHEIAAPTPPTAEEYAEEIQRDTTSIRRLQTIRRELIDHPDIRDAIVVDLGGQEIQLGNLLSQVGRGRQSGGS